MSIILSKIKDAKEILTFITAIAAVIAVVIGAFNAISLNTIEPIVAHLEKLDISVQAVTKDDADDVSQADFTNTLNILRAEMQTRDNDIIHRLDIISTRLDNIIRK